MNYLHYHPDGAIYIRDVNDAAVYEATFDEFKSDYGQPFPPLPDGMAQLELCDGVVFMYDRKQNERDAYHVDPAPYQAVLDAAARLVEAKSARLVFRSPPRPAEQEIIPSTRP